MTIAIDVDGVCADLHTPWLAAYNDDYDDCMTPEDITSWNMHEHVKLNCGRNIYKYLKAELYDKVKPVEGALQAVNALREAGYRVIFVTSTNVHHGGRKLKWLSDHGFLNLANGSTSKDYCEAQDKTLIRADVLIDDCLDNLTGFKGQRILFSHPHNRYVEFDDSVTRADDWADALMCIGPIVEESVLQEAERIVNGARNRIYGSPKFDYRCTGRMWAAMLTHHFKAHNPGLLTEDMPNIPPEIATLMMGAVKMSRLMKTPGHRDSLVDIAGYAACSAKCSEVD
jgi:5'-nucleotidase